MRRSWRAPFAVIVAIAVVAAVVSVDSPGVARAAWRGDNGRIFFVCRITVASQTDICSVKPDGSDLQNLTDSTDLRESQPAVSRDGRKVAFVRGTFSDARVWVMNADGTGLVQVTQLPSDAPAFTPEGRISFRAQTGDTTYEFMIVRSTGGSAVTLAPATGSHRAPRWATDGRYVYSKFVEVPAQPGNFTEQMFVVDGDTERQVTKSQASVPSNSFGEISPDGRTIYYTRSGVTYRAPSTATGGAGEVALTPTPVGFTQYVSLPSPSPDGTRLVVQDSVAPNVTSLSILRTDGSEKQPVSIAGVYSSANPYWAPAPVDPSLTVDVPQRRSHTKTVPVTLRARGASYAVTVTGTVVVPRHPGSPKATFTIGPKRITVAQDQKRVVEFSLTKKAKARVSGALSAGKKPVLQVVVRTGPSSPPIARRTVTLVR